jgi:hypothetical protein
MRAAAALTLLATLTPVGAGGLQPPGPAPEPGPLPQASPVDAALADLERRREALIRAYDLEAQRPRLDRYARTCTRAFRDPALARQDPVGRLPFVANDRREFLQRTAAFAAERLGVRVSSLTVRFARLPRNTAGQVQMAGDRATVEVADRHRDDDEQLLAVLAHEFAHVVLDAPDSGVSERDADDEELVDAMVVMAGLGPLLLRSSYREGLSTSRGRVVGTIRRTGSLHPVAIAYLTLVQSEMAGLTEEAQRGLVGNWIEPAWSVRREAAGGRREASGERGPRAEGGLVPALDLAVWNGFAANSAPPAAQRAKIVIGGE